MTDKKKLFWLGKGTIGDIKTGEEIPDGYLVSERLLELEKKGLIGEKIVATTETDSIKDLEIKDLKSEKLTLEKKLAIAEKDISKLEALLKEETAAKNKALEAENKSSKKAGK